MQACGDNVHWWKKYKKMYGAFEHRRGDIELIVRCNEEKKREQSLRKSY